MEITKKEVEESITQEIFLKVGFKSWVCVLLLNTGTEVVGTYSGVSQDLEVSKGKENSRKDAVIKAKESLKSITNWRLVLEKIKTEETASKNKENTSDNS